MNREQLEKYVVSEKTTVVEALQKIDLNAKGIVFILDEKEKLSGVITDGDIRRWLIKTGNLHTSVDRVMNKYPKMVYRKDKAMAMETMLRYDITAIPVVSSKNILIDIILREKGLKEEEERDTDTLKDKKVIIMAGGKGTRLYPYTKVLPKPLIPVGEIPIIERIIDRFVDFGVTDFYATLNYKKSMIKSYFADIDTEYDIKYVEENKPLGTAGSIHLIDEKFTQPVIVTNCDILINADYADIYKKHVNSGNAMTIVTALKNILVPYGVINPKSDGSVGSMEEKPKLSYFVNTGMYIINPEVIDMIPKDTFFHMTDLTDVLLKNGYEVGMYPVSEEAFLDMGEFEEMRKMEEKLEIKSE